MPDAFGNVTGLEFALASQQQTNAFLGNLNNQIGAGVWNPATSPNTDPNTGMTYPGAGMVQSYPSFGEASGYVYPGYGPRPGVETQQPDYSSYVPEQAFSPSGGAGGYSPSYTPQSMAQYNSNPNRGDDWVPSFDERAYPPQLPDVIGNGGYPTLDQRWEPLYEPYNNAPLNNALYDRSMQLAPETGIPADWGGGGGRGYTPSGAPPRGSAEWYGGGWDMIPDASYNPIQQYQSSGYNPFVSSYENDLNQTLQGINQAPAPSYAPPDTLQQGDYSAMPARGSAEWYGAGWDMIPEASLNAMNRMPQRDAIAQAIMQQPTPPPPPDLGGATITPSPDFTSNNPTLAAQRSPFAEMIRNDPAKALQLAAIMHSEDQNSADSRVAILEAMLNRYNATGQDPFNPDYYPQNTKQYRDAYERLSNDNTLLNQVQQEMERAWGGSNISNYATDWASDIPGGAQTATNALKYSTGTWTAPTGEVFYRKDQTTLDPATGTPWAGLDIAKQNQDWYLRSSTTNQ